MKKLSILLVVMCLLLCACADENTEQSGTNNTGNKTDMSAGNVEATASTYQDHVLFPQVYGAWVFENYNGPGEYELYQNLSINEDGTCTVDGVEGIWKVNEWETNDNFLRLDIYVDSQCVYSPLFYMSGDHLVHCAGAQQAAAQQTTFTRLP